MVFHGFIGFPMFLSSRIYKIHEKQRNFNFEFDFELGIRS